MPVLIDPAEVGAEPVNEPLCESCISTPSSLFLSLLLATGNHLLLIL